MKNARKFFASFALKLALAKMHESYCVATSLLSAQFAAEWIVFMVMVGVVDHWSKSGHAVGEKSGTGVWYVKNRIAAPALW